MKTYLCIDIGGTTIKSGIFDHDGYIIERFSLVDTDNSDQKRNIVTSLMTIINQAKINYTLSGICISTAGVVDPNTGEVIYAGYTIPNYTNTPLKALVETNFQLPCEVENDVNCACLGEYWKGSLRDVENGICLTVGTGIGGSLLRDGEIEHGIGFTAGEVGYLLIDGQKYQDVASTTYLINTVNNHKQTKLNGKEIFESAKNGDVICVNGIKKMIDNLSIGLINMMYLLNPEVIVLGGGIMAQKEYLEPLINDSIAKNIEDYRFFKTKILFAELENDAGMIGALYNFKKRH